ncbi:MAG: cell division protein FtsL [Acidimicrobiia bacterium]|nr:cell division protein FtsL [Acidimicrobiia bacterium]
MSDVGASVGLLTIVGLALFMGTLLASVAVQTLLFEARIGVDDLEAEIAGEQQRRAQLQAEVATLESPARILSEAQSRLGMAPASGRTYLAPVVPGALDAPIPPPGDDPFRRAPETTIP